jgi:hypothetical protein
MCKQSNELLRSRGKILGALLCLYNAIGAERMSNIRVGT